MRSFFSQPCGFLRTGTAAVKANPTRCLKAAVDFERCIQRPSRQKLLRCEMLLLIRHASDCSPTPSLTEGGMLSVLPCMRRATRHRVSTLTSWPPPFYRGRTGHPRARGIIGSAWPSLDGRRHPSPNESCQLPAGMPPYFCSHFSSSRTFIFPCQGFLLRPWPSPGKIRSLLGMPRE